MKPIKAYWCICKGAPTNFGDVLTPYLVEKLTGRPAKWSRSARGYVYMVTGSIMPQARPNSIVWGCGIKRWSDTLRFTPRRIAAVRGPLTRAWLLEHGIICPDVYGDPALLLPRIYQPKNLPSVRLGIIPHFVDYPAVASMYAEKKDVRVINVLDPVESVIDAITSCECTVASSLHGLMTAHAYGIPSLWVRFSDSVSGDDVKFRDYFESVNLPVHCIDRSGGPKLDIESLAAEAQAGHRQIDIDLDRLMAVCPLKLQGR